jgi:hypothetical protein
MLRWVDWTKKMLSMTTIKLIECKTTNSYLIVKINVLL